MTAWLALSVGTPMAAQTQVTEFTGTVTIVTVMDDSIEAALAELGIVLGAPITLEITIDTTVPGEPGIEEEYTSYEGALADFRLTVGAYEAFYHMPVTPHANNVLVGNNVPSPGVGPTDSYTFATLGAESPALFQGDGPFDVLVFNGVVADATGKTMPNDGLVQNLKAFQFGSGAVGGSKGGVAFALTLGKAPKGPSPLAVAQSKQLKAAGVFIRAVMLAHAKSVAQPLEKDPEGAKLMAALDKATAKLTQQFTKAVDKSAAKGVTPPLELDDLLEFMEYLPTWVEDYTLHLDAENPVDRLLHAKILRAIGRHAAADCGAQAAHIVKPSLDKLGARIGKSYDTHIAVMTKAIAAAAKKGVEYAGPDAETSAGTVRVIVDEILVLVQD